MSSDQPNPSLSRRGLLTSLAAAAVVPALAQAPRDWSGRTPVALSRSRHHRAGQEVRKSKIGNTPIQRLHTGTLWAEGPAWNGAGRYLVWSDIPNDRQMRWLEEDGHVSVMRKPSQLQQRQYLRLRGPAALLRARQPPRRALRTQRQRHRDGRQVQRQTAQRAERHRGPSRWRHLVYRSGLRHPRAITKGTQGKLELKEAVYRIDPKTAKIEMVTDDLFKPNGLCFSPDYKKLYVCDTGSTTTRKRRRTSRSTTWRTSEARKGREFINMEMPRQRCRHGRRHSRGYRRQYLGRRGLGGRGYDGVTASRRRASGSA